MYSTVNGKIYADVVGGIGVVDICLIDNTDLHLTDDIFEELSSRCKCMILSRHDLSGIMAREEIGLYLVRPSDDGFLFREVINEFECLYRKEKSTSRSSLSF